jgi:hypothetical protein
MQASGWGSWGRPWAKAWARVSFPA